MAVAISYAKERRFTNAVPVYRRFLDDHPRHTRALRGIGTSYLFQQDYPEAISYLRRSWSLGDVNSLSTLAAAYVRSGKYAQMEDLIPSLVDHAQGDFEIANCLVAFAIFYKDPPDVKLVLKAFAGLPDQDILFRDDTTQLVSEVVSRFGRSAELELAQLPILAKIISGSPEKLDTVRRV